MRGIPEKNNFKVVDLLTNEIKEYKTLNEIAKEYNENYYTIRGLYLINDNIKTKSNPQRKILKLQNKISIVSL